MDTQLAVACHSALHSSSRTRRSQGLQASEPFLAKAIQLYETTLVRLFPLAKGHRCKVLWPQ